MKRMLSALLRMRGFHFLATRVGSTRIRSLAFDEKYRSGAWNFAGKGRDPLVDVIERYANKGAILLLGCGYASLLKDLNPDSFSTLLGVDLSGEAVRVARESFGNAKVRFEKADMLAFQNEESYNLIVFSESLYYVRSLDQKHFLQRLAKSLNPGGLFIVTVADPQRYEDILLMIRRNFQCEEDRQFVGAKRHLIVFRPAVAKR